MSVCDPLLANLPRLPIADALDRIAPSIKPGHALVLSSPPGSGKTTVLPPLLEASLDTRVIVCAPRQIAVRSAARHLACLLGEKVGDTSGYRVRGDVKVSDRTRVEFVTPGIMLRRLQGDPELEGVGAVVIDEFHERHLETDLSLAFILDTMSVLRPDLHLTLTSATLNADRLASFLGGVLNEVDVVDVPGALHPITTHWMAPSVQPLATTASGNVVVAREFISHIVSVTRQAVSQTNSDILVFVPGAKEIDEAAQALGGFGPHEVSGVMMDVRGLHGHLAPGQQDAILSVDDSQKARRIIITTSIAESSLTVPGIGCVVDSGLARVPSYDVQRDAGSLITVPAPRASCDQRAGRSARLGPGTVYRCFDQVSFARRPDQITPEILSTDLADAELQARCWTSGGLDALELIDPAPPGALKRARERLHAADLVDDDYSPTTLGRRVARLPVSPFLGKALIAASPLIGSKRAAYFVALLGENPRVGDGDLAHFARRLKAEHADIARRVRQSSQRLERWADPHSDPGRLSDDEAIGLVAGLAHPTWIARARGGQSGTYLFADGQGACLPPSSLLAGSEWLAITDVTRSVGRADGLIRAAVPISAEDALSLGHSLITERTDCTFSGGCFRATATTMLGAIALGQPRNVKPSPENVMRLLTNEFAAHGLSMLKWTESATHMRARLTALHAVAPDMWPDVSDDALIGDADSWCAPFISALAEGESIARIDTASLIRSLIPWQHTGSFDEWAPADIEIPTGERRKIDWSTGTPTVTLRVQEAFGWTATPTFANGRLPLLIHLTDPAGRPTAVTSDLASFWAEPYQQVRSQLRGRYPKHLWPEDPMSAKPTSRAKPRR